MADAIRIEVAYLDQERPVVRSYTLPAGATVRDALLALRADWNAEDWIDGRKDVGVFGRVVPRDMLLAEDDRVELYDALLKDPKTARRDRARSAARTAPVRNSGRA